MSETTESAISDASYNAFATELRTSLDYARKNRQRINSSIADLERDREGADIEISDLESRLLAHLRPFAGLTFTYHGNASITRGAEYVSERLWPDRRDAFFAAAGRTFDPDQCNVLCVNLQHPDTGRAFAQVCWSRDSRIYLILTDPSEGALQCLREVFGVTLDVTASIRVLEAERADMRLRLSRLRHKIDQLRGRRP